MIEIPVKFKAQNCLFEQIKRENNVAIFKRTRLAGKDDIPAGAVGYEVVRITRHNGFELGGNFVKPAEVYPSARAWGRLGLSAPTLEVAEAQYIRMQEKFKGKDNLTGKKAEEESGESVIISNPDGSTGPAPKPSRGRKALNVEIDLPNLEEFCLKDVEKVNKDKKVSGGYIYLRIKALEESNVLRISDKRKVSGGKGRATVFYKRVINKA